MELVTSTALSELDETLTGPIGELTEEELVLLEEVDRIVDTELNVMGVVRSVIEVGGLVMEAVVADDEVLVDRDWLLLDTADEEVLLKNAIPLEIEL